MCKPFQEFLLTPQRPQKDIYCIYNSTFYGQWELADWEVNIFLLVLMMVIHIHKNHLQYPTLYASMQTADKVKFST